MEKSLALLVAAHFLGDFMLQPDWLIKRKERLPFFLLHVLVHGILVYILYQNWSCWQLPLGVVGIHVVIDKVKQKSSKDSARKFAWDQIAHIVTLLLIGIVMINNSYIKPFSGQGYQWIIILAGFNATVSGAGYFVGKVAKEMRENNQLKIDGLKGGGARIGSLERAMIFLLIFINQPAGIGFLVAAKSILRFEEAKNKKLAEYVLIGTLMSFSLAIAIASMSKWAMNLR